MHRDCFQIFLQHTRAHKHITAYNLWHAAHARYPWRGFWPLPQTTLDEDAVSLAMTHAAAHWRMPLDMLPNELLLLVCENLRCGVFWRHVLAKEFTRKLIAEANYGATTMATLSQIGSWTRGSAPTRATPDAGSYFRLTIDSYGLREIERLAKFPAKSPLRSEMYAYVVDNMERLGQISASFKVGTSYTTYSGLVLTDAVWTWSALPTQRNAIVEILGHTWASCVTRPPVLARAATNLSASRHHRNAKLVWNYLFHLFWLDRGNSCAHNASTVGLLVLPATEPC